MRYESYKPSGVAWLGEIPEHWDSKYLGACFSERREKVSDKIFKALSVTKKGIVPQLETAAKSNAGDNRKKVLKGDFVINGRSDRKGSSGISYLDGSVSLINIVLKPKELFLSKYTHYLLRSVPFQEEYYRNGKGIVADLWSTNISEMRKILLPIPPLEEQETIIRYLNFYEHKINKAIATKKKLIATLSEQKQAIIAHAVTKGVDLHVKMKPSDISWLGEIPEHWDIRKIKYICKIKYGNSLEAKQRRNGDVPVYGSNGIVGIHNQAITKAPCIIIGRKGSFGKINVSKKACFPIDTAYYIDELNRKNYNFEWFVYILSTIGLDEISRDTGVPGLNRDDVYSRKIPLPPLDEQKAIVEFIEQETASIDKAIELSKKEIELLQEYKTRLIADVVTGAVDVRKEAQNLPEIEEDSFVFESDEPLDLEELEA